MSELTPAPPWLRLAAILYDLLIVLAMWMLIAALVLVAFQGEVDVARQPPFYHFVLQIMMLSVTAGYFVVSWVRGGQTIGMRAWRVRLIGERQPAISWSRAWLRFVVALVSLLVAGIGFFWCLFDAERRGWHDLAARTRMVRVPKH